MQTQHNSAIHQILSTPVRLDLGSTVQDIIVTRDRVTELPQVVSDALKPTQDSIGQLAPHVTTQSQRVVRELAEKQTETVNAAVTAIKASMSNEVKKVLDKLAALPAPMPVPGPGPGPGPALAIVTDSSAPLVRLLTQVLTLAMDATPGQPDKQNKTEWGENVALKKLHSLAKVQAEAHGLSGEAKTHFLAAFEPFGSDRFDERHRRFNSVHALIPVITAHLV